MINFDFESAFLRSKTPRQKLVSSSLIWTYGNEEEKLMRPWSTAVTAANPSASETAAACEEINQCFGVASMAWRFPVTQAAEPTRRGA